MPQVSNTLMELRRLREENARLRHELFAERQVTEALYAIVAEAREKLGKPPS